MNHPIDREPETDPRPNSKHLKLLEALIDNIIEALQDKSCKPKVRDALLAIKLTQQVAKTSEAEGIFWDMIDDIRNSELSEPVSIEAQIQRTILRLSHQVKNGILPVKIITDTFNQSRSEQARLTCRRMSSLLSSMGFTKVRASNGSSAIIWDDNRLVARPRKEASSIRPPEREVDPEDHERVVLNPPDIEDPQGRRSVGKEVHPEGDLGGYDQNAGSAEDATDHRYTIPGPGVKS